MRTKRPKDKLVLDISGIPQGGVISSVEIVKRTGKLNSNVRRDIRDTCKEYGVAENVLQDIPDERKPYMVPYYVLVKLADRYNKGIILNQPLLIPADGEFPVEKVKAALTKVIVEEFVPECGMFEPVAIASTGKVEIDFSAAAEGATMSTDQIAEFLNRKTNHILRDFRKFCEDNGLTAAQFWIAVPYASGNGAIRERDVYKLPQNICFAFIAKYNPMLVSELTLKWQEAERRHRTESGTTGVATRQEMFDVVGTGDIKLLRKFLEHQEKAYVRIETLTTKLVEVETKLIEQKAEFDAKLVEQKATTDAELARKDVIVREVLNDNVLLKEKYSKLKAYEAVDEIRIPLNRYIAANGLIKATALGTRVEAFLGWEKGSLLRRPDVEKNSPQPNKITQALLDLEYCVMAPKRDREWIDETTGHKIKIERVYGVHPRRVDDKGNTWVACRKLTHYSPDSENYALAVNSVLYWHPAIIGEVASYMLKLKSDRDQLKAKKQKGK